MKNNILLLGFILQTQVFAQFTIQTKVAHIIDGDTFIATINNKAERIRMKCIDAPELKQTFIGFDGKQKEIGIEARECLKSLLVESRFVTLKCNDERDKYERLTCDILDDKGNNINIQMVKNGYAYALPSRCFSEVDSMKYLGYQYLARFSQAGLWRYGGWDDPARLR
jgi:micrococcal nuclease